jgi:hypothetical protein
MNYVHGPSTLSERLAILGGMQSLMPLGFSNRLPENPLSLLPPVLQSSFAAARLSTPRIIQNLEPTLAERLLLHSHPSLRGGAQQGYNPFALVMRPMSLQAGHLERAFMAMQARDEQQLLSNKIQLTQHAMALYNSRGHTPLSSYYTAAPQKQPEPPRKKKEYSLTGRPPILLYIAKDDVSLSEYQCLVRNQIEVFEATQQDVKTGAQGRNRPIVLGQVGLRCRHCAILPRRKRGAVYYPARLDRVYQAAQNMSKAHLMEQCQQMGTQLERSWPSFLKQDRLLAGVESFGLLRSVR